MHRFVAFVFLILVITPVFSSIPAGVGKTGGSSPSPPSSSRGTLSSLKSYSLASQEDGPLDNSQHQYFKGQFHVITGSRIVPTNQITVTVGASSQIDFTAKPESTIDQASINITIPRLTLKSNGTTSFNGNIPGGSSVVLRFLVMPITETEEIINVHATGDVQIGSPAASYHTDEYYDFALNTTGWYNVTHTNPPYDPYGKNATVLPTVNITSIGQYVVPSTLASNQPQPLSADPVMVTGSLFYKPLNGAPDCPGGLTMNGCPVRGARIDVQDEDSCVSDHRVGTTNTDNSGSFSVSFGRSFGPFGSCTVNNFHVSALSTNDATAQSAPGCGPNCGVFEAIIAKIGSNYGTPLSDNAVFNLGPKGLSGDDPGFQVYDDLLQAARRISSFGFAVTWEQVGVYQAGDCYNPHTNIGQIPDGVTFFPNPATNCPSNNNMPYAWGSSTVFHEWGHAMMERIYGSGIINWPCGAGCTTVAPHYANSVSGTGFAISEGWAEFISQLIFGSVNTGVGCCATDLESGDGFVPVAMTCVNQGHPAPPCSGDWIEGAVASVFWDLQFGGEEGNTNLLHYLIGTNKDDNSEFHNAHRNDMLDEFTDILNAGQLQLSTLCQIYTEYGLSPPQCKGVATFATGFLALGFLLMLGPATHTFRRKSPGAASLGRGSIKNYRRRTQNSAAIET